MASILPLPNIGNQPAFELVFRREATGAVRAERASNARTTFEAFWPDARVLDATAATGQLSLRYEGPTRSSGRVAQSVDVRLCSSEGGPVPPPPAADPPETRAGVRLRADLTVGDVLSLMQGGGGVKPMVSEWLVSEVFQQENVEQGKRGEYLVLTSYRRAAPDVAGRVQTVLSQQRIAAFLLPTDGDYLEAQGNPVALYDYSYTLTRLPDE